MRLKLFLFFILITVLGVMGFLRWERRLLDAPERAIGVKKSWLADGKLIVGVLGDSWVYDNKITGGLDSALSEVDFYTEIISCGQPGATSKEVLQNIIISDGQTGRCERLMSRDVDVVVVIAGVNDIANYCGAPFYAHHLMETGEYLYQNGKTPFLVTLPEFGVEETYRKRPFIKKVLKALPARVIFDHNEINPEFVYRDALSEAFDSSVGIEIIDFNEYIPDYEEYTHLYKNTSHLNEEGSNGLGFFIGKQLIKYLKSENLKSE